MEASNDLNIGNFTFAAGKFRASRIAKGSVIIGGTGGLLTEHSEFTFAKGVLTTPSLKVDVVESDINFKGHAIRYDSAYCCSNKKTIAFLCRYFIGIESLIFLETRSYLTS